VKIPEVIDWLSDVELKMAKEAKPQETLEGLVDQINGLQVCCVMRNTLQVVGSGRFRMVY